MGEIKYTDAPSFRVADFYVLVKFWGHGAEFTAYEIVGADDDDRPLFQIETPGPGRYVTKPDQSPVFASIAVKWDGCTNFHFPQSESCMLHTCDREGLAAIGELLTTCWDRAGELVPMADPYAFGKRRLGE